MLKIAFQLGVQQALADHDVDRLTKEASKAGLARRALDFAKANKGLTAGVGLAGAGALGAGGYFGGKHLLKEDEPGFLESAGDLAQGLTSDPQLMQSLLGAAMGGGGMGGGMPQGAMGLSAGGGGGFPPSPSYGAQMGAMPMDPYEMQGGYGGHLPPQY